MLLQSTQADIILECALLIGQVRQLEWLNNSINDERGAEPSSQAQEERSAALIAPQRLHRCIIDKFYGTLEGVFEIEADPSRSQVAGFQNWFTLENRTWVANGDHVVFPISRQLLNRRDHLFRCHRRA